MAVNRPAGDPGMISQLAGGALGTLTYSTPIMQQSAWATASQWPVQDWNGPTNQQLYEQWQRVVNGRQAGPPTTAKPAKKLEPVPLGGLIEGLEKSGPERIAKFL